jgi:hypothetical protein
VAFGAVPLDWAIAGVGDYDGDGRSDLLWRQASTGAVYLWRFTSPTTMAGQDIGPVGGEEGLNPPASRFPSSRQRAAPNT